MDSSSYFQRVLAVCDERQVKPTNHALYVSIGEQKLWAWEEGKLRKIYAVSTSRKPPSCVENSLGTPTGLHVIDEKIGDGLPAGAVLKGRVPTGENCYELEAARNEENLITTRILWLRGLEKGVNAGPGVDTHDRYVYLHGTNQEDRIGTPNSHGCVLLSNEDVVELFDATPSGALVLIEL
ncbi:L,D-transpeptidase [Cerasicoccus maritimus]|uniref:L,D-transpeptidase n=1 Tax=Cerasicoccus maritimus TaxID=490089 RepID=UPI0028525B21|nr:L,D-transpeptidase [Cerasicoccus maritimus]